MERVPFTHGVCFSIGFRVPFSRFLDPFSCADRFVYYEIFYLILFFAIALDLEDLFIGICVIQRRFYLDRIHFMLLFRMSCVGFSMILMGKNPSRFFPFLCFYSFIFPYVPFSFSLFRQLTMLNGCLIFFLYSFLCFLLFYPLSSFLFFILSLSLHSCFS